VVARSLSDDELVKTVETYKKLGLNKSAAKLKISVNALSHRIRLFEKRFQIKVPRDERFRNKPAPPAAFEMTELPDDDISVDELLKHRKRQFDQKSAHEAARKLIPVQIKLDGAIAILHHGDPHVDDDGTDIHALERNRALCIKTEGLFAANVGDLTNNWVGRLAKLYGEQGTTAKQAWALAEWFISDQPWLYMIAGNHDTWSGEGDPLKWIARQARALYQASEVRLELQFPNARTARINARHDFAGHSQYNPVHGQTKATIFGVRDHIAVAGHRHTSGYGVLKDPQHGIVSHLLQVASYKIFDRYARDKGFRDMHLSPCAVTTINPALPDDHPDMIKVWWDPEAGVDYLRFLRGRRNRRAG
jgi:hypothetical protein